MRAGLTISVAGHVTLLAWGLVSFTSQPLKAVTGESLPVDIISDKEFSEVTKGIKTAKQTPNQKPLVEKLAENRPIEDPEVKISPKPEIKAANDATPPPQEKPEPKKEPPKEAKAEPKPKPPEPKPEPPKEAKVEPKPKPEPKVDPIAEALKKEEAKKPEKQPEKPPEKQAEKKPPEEKKTAEAKPAPAEKTPPQEQKKLDFGKIASLLDKQTPQRSAAGGEQLNPTAARGLPTGNAVAITQSELDALRNRMKQCWLSPPGINSDKLAVEIRVSFNIDGSLSRPPQVLQGAASPYGVMVAESAKRAILRCQPYKMLRKETYERWKEIDMNFDASWMNN